MSDINLKSSTLEKIIDIAKEFLSKIISPPLEEFGLLMGDNIKYYRFKNQIRILAKAKEYVDSKKITTKEISLKLLVPLLENASLEENETLQDIWAKMLVNLVDSNSNFQNHIFPYLLSQISIEEFNGLQILFTKEMNSNIVYKEFEEIKQKEDADRNEKMRLSKIIIDISQNGYRVDLKDFELTNLIRLGLIRLLPPKIKIPQNRLNNNFSKFLNLQAYYDSTDNGYRITALGEKFITVCKLDD